MSHANQTIPSPANKSYVNLLDRISPQIFTFSVAIALTLLNIYFTVAAHDSRIEALETNAVITGNQVITNTAVIVSVNKDIDEIKNDVKEVLRRLPNKE